MKTSYKIYSSTVFSWYTWMIYDINNMWQTSAQNQNTIMIIQKQDQEQCKSDVESLTPLQVIKIWLTQGSHCWDLATGWYGSLIANYMNIRAGLCVMMCTSANISVWVFSPYIPITIQVYNTFWMNDCSF